MYKELFNGFHTLKHTPSWFDKIRIEILASQDKCTALRYRKDIEKKIKECENAS